jgi:hypothetical protein
MLSIRFIGPRKAAPEVGEGNPRAVFIGAAGVWRQARRWIYNVPAVLWLADYLIKLKLLSPLLTHATVIQPCGLYGHSGFDSTVAQPIFLKGFLR